MEVEGADGLAPITARGIEAALDLEGEGLADEPRVRPAQGPIGEADVVGRPVFLGAIRPGHDLADVRVPEALTLEVRAHRIPDDALLPALDLAREGHPLGILPDGDRALGAESGRADGGAPVVAAGAVVRALRKGVVPQEGDRHDDRVGDRVDQLERGLGRRKDFGHDCLHEKSPAEAGPGNEL
ncbi:hypothetical protein D3C86_1153110 [compost metagenome]